MIHLLPCTVDHGRFVSSCQHAGGYPPKSVTGFTPHQVLPEATVLIAESGGVFATMSLVPDTTLLGLPMEDTFAAEVAGLRRAGRRLSETTGLADSGPTGGEFIQVSTAFIKVAMHRHLRQGGDSWVIVVNPRHRSFYLKVLGFASLGPARGYASVQGHPGEAFLLDVPLLKANAPKMHGRIFGEPLPDPFLRPPAWSPARVRHFGGRSTRIDPGRVEELLRWVEHLGSPPRWRDVEAP
jgi:hypothetical protein